VGSKLVSIFLGCNSLQDMWKRSIPDQGRACPYSSVVAALQTCLDDKSIDTEPGENEHPEQKYWQPTRRCKTVENSGKWWSRSLGWWHKRAPMNSPDGTMRPRLSPLLWINGYNSSSTRTGPRI
jgi:hypothetical protein